MELSTLGLLVQTIGAFLLAVILLYLSRGKGNRVLMAAAWGFVFLTLSLVSLWAAFQFPHVTFANVPYLYLKILCMTCLLVAAKRMEHEASLAKPLVRVASVALPVVFGVSLFLGTSSAYYAVHMAILTVGWAFVTVYIFLSRGTGLGKRLSGSLALLTALT